MLLLKEYPHPNKKDWHQIGSLGLIKKIGNILNVGSSFGSIDDILVGLFQKNATNHFFFKKFFHKGGQLSYMWMIFFLHQAHQRMNGSILRFYIAKVSTK